MNDQDLSEDEEPANPPAPEAPPQEPDGGLLEPEAVSCPRTPPKPLRPSVIARFASALGYRPNGEDRFYHGDGS